MKTPLLLIIVCALIAPLAFAKRNDDPTLRQKILSAAEVGKKALAKFSTDPLTNEQATELANLIRDNHYFWDFSEPTFTEEVFSSIRILKLLYKMQEQKRLYFITDSIKSELDLKKIACSHSDQCDHLHGFYLPLTHYIFLEQNQTKLELARTLYHELNHAYQFTYRFPIDWSTLVRLRDQGLLKGAELTGYLNYFYESQAHWKAMRWSMVRYEAWQKLFRSRDGDRARSFFTTFLSSGLAPLFLMGIGDAIANKVLPQSWGKMDIWKQRFFGEEAALILPEMILLESSPNRINGIAGNFDFTFHRLFGAAIEKTYFGKMGFLFDHERDDLRIFNTLHDQYYERLSSDVVDVAPKCKSLIEKVSNGVASPLVAWLTMEKESLDSCPTYRDTLDRNSADEYIDLFLKINDPSSPFRGMKPGIEGSRPDLTILPQLEVRPERLKR